MPGVCRRSRSRPGADVFEPAREASRGWHWPLRPSLHTTTSMPARALETTRPRVLWVPQHMPITQRTPMTDDITSLQEQLAAHRRTLAVYLRQLANLGVEHAPPSVHNGIVEARREIARLKAALRDAGVAVVDGVRQRFGI
jgi:hypothetical protein